MATTKTIAAANVTSGPTKRGVVSRIVASLVLAAAVVPGGAACSGHIIDLDGDRGSQAPVCDLGTVWDEVEDNGVCNSTWTREGQSDTFDDSQPDCGVSATLTFSVSGNELQIARTNSSDGNDCNYQGTFSSDCSGASGTYLCGNSNMGPGPWSATIVAGGSGE
jgi:hypothetical protein